MVLRVDIWARHPVGPATSVSAALAMAGELLLSEGGSGLVIADSWSSAQLSGAGGAVLAARHLQCALEGFSHAAAGGRVGYRCTLFNADFPLAASPDLAPRPSSATEEPASGTVLVAGGLSSAIRTLPGLAFKPSASAAPLGPSLELLPSAELEDALRQIASHRPPRSKSTARRVAPQWAATQLTHIKQRFAAHTRGIPLVAAAICFALAAVSIGIVAARHAIPKKPADPAATYVVSAPAAIITTPGGSPPATAPTLPASDVPSGPAIGIPAAAPATPGLPPPQRKLGSSAASPKKAPPPKPAPVDRSPAPHGGVTFEPSEIASLNTKAESAAGDGDYDRAIQLYQLVLRYDPNNAEARRGLDKARRNKASR